ARVGGELQVEHFILCAFFPSHNILIKKRPVNPQIQHTVQARIIGCYKIAGLAHGIAVCMVVSEQDACSLDPEVKESIHHRVGKDIEIVLKIKLLGGGHIGICIITASVPPFQADLYIDIFVEQGPVEEKAAVDKQFRDTEFIRGIPGN